MFTHRSSVAVITALVGAVFMGASPHAGTSWGRTNHITFNVPLGLPGVTLAPGTYIFELADPLMSHGHRSRVQQRPFDRLPHSVHRTRREAARLARQPAHLDWGGPAWHGPADSRLVSGRRAARVPLSLPRHESIDCSRHAPGPASPAPLRRAFLLLPCRVVEGNASRPDAARNFTDIGQKWQLGEGECLGRRRLSRWSQPAHAAKLFDG